METIMEAGMSETLNIRLKRAYDDPARSDGYRVLVDGVWPRGVSKEELDIEEWLRGIAPSSELRKWFGHDPEKWPEFRQRYAKELQASEADLQRLAEKAREGRITLIYGAKDREHNQAVVLRDILRERYG